MADAMRPQLPRCLPPSLADVELGGETAFPRSRWIDKEKQTAGQPFTDCAKGGVAALARKGGPSAAPMAPCAAARPTARRA